jgi:hypothetical protein
MNQPKVNDFINQWYNRLKRSRNSLYTQLGNTFFITFYDECLLQKKLKFYLSFNNLSYIKDETVKPYNNYDKRYTKHTKHYRNEITYTITIN